MLQIGRPGQRARMPAAARIASGLRREAVGVPLLLALAVAALYAPVVFAGRTLVPSTFAPHALVSASRQPATTFQLDLGTPAYYEFPLNALIGQAYRQGEIPLWNPYQAAGVPLAAQGSTRAFFPYQILEDIAPPQSWDWFLLGRLWIAGLLAYLLFRRWGLSRAAAIAGGLLYQFSGAMVWFLTLEQFANPAMLLPGLLWAIDGVVLRPERRSAVTAALLMAGMALAGQPEVALYAFTLAGVTALWRLAALGRQGRSAYTRLGGWSVVAVALAVMIAAPLLLPFLSFISDGFHGHPAGGNIGTGRHTPEDVLIAILLPGFFAGPTFDRLLPTPGFWDFLGGSVGVTGAFLAALALARPGPQRGLATLLVIVAGIILLKNVGSPLFEWIGRLPGYDQVWSNRWAGPTWTLALVGAAAIGVDRLGEVGTGGARRWPEALPRALRSRWGVVAAIIVIVVLQQFTLGPQIVPGSGVPSRGVRVVLLLVESALVMAVALRMGYGRQPLRPAATGAVIVPVAVVVVGVLFLLFAASGEPVLRGLSGSEAWASRLGGLVLAGTLLGLLIWLDRQAAGAAPLRRGHLLLAVGVAAAAGMAVAAPRGYAGETPALMFIPAALWLASAIALALRRHRMVGGLVAAGVLVLALIDVTAPAGLPRRTDPFRADAFLTFLQERSREARVVGVEGTLLPDFGSALGIADVRFINAVSVTAYQRFTQDHLLGGVMSSGDPINDLWFTGLLTDQRNEPRVEFVEVVRRNRAAYRLLAVRYYLTPAATAARLGETPVLEVGGRAVVEDAEALPRTYVARELLSASSVTKAQALAVSMGAAVGRAVVEDSALVERARQTQRGGGEAVIESTGLNRVTVRAATKTGGLLVLTDTFAPGWHATIDGEAAKIVRVNGLVRGVWLEPGDHRVEFRYLPRSFLVGVSLAGAALIGCALLWWGPAVRRLGRWGGA